MCITTQAPPRGDSSHDGSGNGSVGLPRAWPPVTKHPPSRRGHQVPGAMLAPKGLNSKRLGPAAREASLGGWAQGRGARHDCIPGGHALSSWVPVAQRMNQHHQVAASSTLLPSSLRAWKLQRDKEKDFDKVPENLWPPPHLEEQSSDWQLWFFRETLELSCQPNVSEF